MQVKVRFPVRHADAVSMHNPEAVMDHGGYVLEVHCDLVVSGLAVDTPEAANALGIMCRFFHRPSLACDQNGSLAGCVVCNTPAEKYAEKPSDLEKCERKRRTVAETRALRQTGDRQKMHEAGGSDLVLLCKTNPDPVQLFPHKQRPGDCHVPPHHCLKLRMYSCGVRHKCYYVIKSFICVQG